MCFGNKETGRKTESFTANPAVESAAVNNLNFAQNLQNTGFTPYTGEQVAQFSGQQQNSFGMADAVAGNGTAPISDAWIRQYANAGPQSVSSAPISSAMSPYMNQYVMQALAPQMHQMDMANAKQDAAVNAQATMSGGFGDARAGIEAANTRFNQDVMRTGVIGQAYDRAFNTAIGAGAQDVSNNMAAQNANAGYAESALARALGGSQALQGLQNQQMGIAQGVNQFGQQQTAQDQAGLTAQYNQWLMAQQYPFQTASLINQSISAANPATSSTKTGVTSAPDNSGWAMAGALLPLMFSDRRLKTDIAKVGVMLDGTPIYAYRYKGSPKMQIGVMAQDIEQIRPDAVTEVAGFKAVDYGKATALSRALALDLELEAA